MALHPDFPESPHAIIDPSVRWLPDQTLLFDAAGNHLFSERNRKAKTRSITF